MSHAQSQHLTLLGGKLPLKREISTHWKAGLLFMLTPPIETRGLLTFFYLPMFVVGMGVGRVMLRFVCSRAGRACYIAHFGICMISPRFIFLGWNSYLQGGLSYNTIWALGMNQHVYVVEGSAWNEMICFGIDMIHVVTL